MKRGLIVASRRGRLYGERMTAVLLTTAVVAAWVGAWQWWGWDRMTGPGAATFAMSLFWAIVFVQVVVAIGQILGGIGPAIAVERDKKSLDAVLTTRLTSAEIVLGTWVAGLLRTAHALAAAVPVVIAVVVVLRVDFRLVLLVAAAFASSALFAGALAVAGSAVARNRAGAIVLVVLLADAWLALPVFVLMAKGALGLRWPPWLVQVVLWLLDSGPLGLAANLAGVFPRPGGIVAGVGRMVAMQAPGTVLTLAWAIRRLRPASREAHDSEGRTALRRLLSSRQWRRRPPCGDDPVLWQAIHSGRAMSRPDYALNQLVKIAMLGVLAVGTWWFGGPAFAELRERGYGPDREAFRTPEFQPVAREIVAYASGLKAGPATGQARLELNIVLRQSSAATLFLFAMMIASNGAVSVQSERDRDTWLGLIATPLDGRAILRGKLIGALARARGVAAILVVLWTIGLLAGAVHPLGFLAALASLAVSGLAFATISVVVSLRMKPGTHRESLALLLLLYLAPLGGLAAVALPGSASLLLGATSAPVLTWLSLFSYEDVEAIVHGGVLPQFAGAGSLKTGAGARLALATLLIGVAALALLSLQVGRAACRDFDRLIGRPTRS